MEDRRNIVISGNVFGAAKGKDEKTYQIIQKPKADSIKIEAVTATNWNEEDNEWTDAIIYPDSGAEVVRFSNCKTLETIVLPRSIRMGFLSGEKIREVQLTEGIELFAARECPSLTEVHLPRSVKIAVLHPNTTVTNFEDFNKNPESEIIYNTKKGVELNEIDGIRPLMVNILTDLNNKIDNVDA